MSGFSQCEQLGQIAAGELQGEAATAVLRRAIVEQQQASRELSEYSAAVGRAENYLLYGEAGRPVPQTFRTS